MTDDQIKHMVNRFLSWKLPRDSFNPDGGISFDKKPYNTHTAHPMKHEPSGTNLFDAEQATAMVRYMVEGILITAEAVARRLCEVRRGDSCHRQAFTGHMSDCNQCDFAEQNSEQAKAVIELIEAVYAAR